jgi:SAM-dependent methyltransferase
MAAWPAPDDSKFLLDPCPAASSILKHEKSEGCQMSSRLVEAISAMFAGKDNPVPPRRLIDDIGGGNFQKIGREFFGYFTTIGGLQPHHRVLDVGCGCGRMAVPMIPFLSGPAEYHGFDIVPDAIKWSQKHIAARHPRFHFAVADVYNKQYNPRGKVKSSEYRFPFPDNFFDFALLTSVFTHMLTADMEHYLAEIARTLKVEGRCTLSFFLLNAGANALMANGKSSIDFKHPMADCTISDPKLPEAAVAYVEDFVRERFAKYNLKIIEPIHCGKWSGRDKFLSFQDIILAARES